MSENLGSVGGAVAVPRPLLSAAVFCVAVSAVLVVPSVFVLHVLGYVLSSFVTIGLVALYRRIDLERRGRVGYVAQPRLAVVANSLAGVGVIVAAIHVWWIATELAG
jgi:4-hydroxybenzoate polyprenyltransferase